MSRDSISIVSILRLHFEIPCYEELLRRDKLSLDLFWLRDESLEGTDKLPPPGEIAAKIVEDLQNALEQFMAIAEDLGGKAVI